MKAAVTIALVLFTATTAQAEKWPEHGFYRVEQLNDGVCRLRTELSFDGKLVALILVPHPGDQLMAQFLSTIPGVIDAPRLRIQAGSAEIANVEPVERLPSAELPSIAAVIPDGAQAMARLDQAAHAGGAMRITALPFDETLPPAGLPLALDDMKVCMSGGSAT